MKMFVVLALAAFAAAEPEADPQLLLGGIHGVHSSYTPYSHVAPVATYASPLWKNMIPALKSVVPAVKTVVSEVKPVVSTPVISSYTGLGAQFPLTYGSGLIRTPFTGINTPYTAGMISPYSGLTHTPFTGINTPYTTGVISPYSGLTHTAVKTVVPAVSSYTGLGAQYGVVAAPTKVVTNYINKDHYTAEATPLGKALGVPSYTAKNGEVVHEVQKREADPALVYSGLTHTPFTGINTPYTAGMISPYSGLTHTPFTGINTPYTAGMISPYSGLTHTPFTGINTPYTAGMISPYSGLTHGIQYRMPYGVQYPMTHAVQKREAEADPALVYSGLTHTPFTGINTPYTAYTGINTPYTAYTGINTPYTGLIRTPFTGINTPYTAGMISPYTGLTHTAAKTVVPTVSAYSHGIHYAEPTKVVTNYINKDHYTAEATPLGKALGVPSYTAKNGEVVHEVQKREADPALVYSGLTHTGISTPYTAGMISPYSGLTHTPFTGINTPYTAGMISPYTYRVSAVKSLIPAVSTPVVSSYTGLTHTPVYKTQDHGVVATYAGLVHSSHAGLCLNNEGVQVAC